MNTLTLARDLGPTVQRVETRDHDLGPTVPSGSVHLETSQKEPQSFFDAP